MSDGPAFREILATVADGRTLTRNQSQHAFSLLMEGQASQAQTAAFLMALRVRTEQVEEIAGAAQAMRAKATRVRAPAGAVDTCGTGGDGLGTVNVSTATALVVAGCGVPVAKHGNRAVSSKSGSSDVLNALGVNVAASVAAVEQAMRVAGVGFLLATVYHPAMRHVGPVRADLGLRTVFNLLGPLANPAGVRRQVIGVFADRWLEPLARVLHELESEHAWIVHGTDGMDELTTTGATRVAELKGGQVRTFTVTPEDAGLSRAAPAELVGGDAAANAASIRNLLDGKRGPYRDIVVLNAAAALIVAQRADDLEEGAAQAARSIDTGAAGTALDRLVECTQEQQ
ncbi:MAG: anthranilate phosphoribosyltransferase [Rhodospirillales bacterium]|nr:anthranilate phosphoribosyltransferase [Rhodospirillales bacterium]